MKHCNSINSYKFGDYTQLAKYYDCRPPYSDDVIDALCAYTGVHNKFICEVGAGTGILTRSLETRKLQGIAVEPNEQMMLRGKLKLIDARRFKWVRGYAEYLPLTNDSVDWIIMASSFHWTNYSLSLPEFYRVLKKPSGYLTIMWNTRDLDSSGFQQSIESKINMIIPNIKRRSSGNSRHTADWQSIIIESNLFSSSLLIENKFTVTMSREQYIGAWKSVNDVRVQAGAIWPDIIKMIELETQGIPFLEVPYITRSWTSQVKV